MVDRGKAEAKLMVVRTNFWPQVQCVLSLLLLSAELCVVGHLINSDEE